MAVPELEDGGFSLLKASVQGASAFEEALEVALLQALVLQSFQQSAPLH